MTTPVGASDSIADEAMADPAGLDDQEAARRLENNGGNELPRKDHKTALSIVASAAREPLMLLLLAAGSLYLLLGDLGEALILLLFASVSLVITIVQEMRTERVLEALRDLTSPQAIVVRGGMRKRIPGREVVVDDIVVLEEGARVPADGRLLQSHDLQTDESLLTGESLPAHKNAVSLPSVANEDANRLFSGSLVVRGTGLARVTATGANSRIGQIGKTLNSLEGEPPRLKSEVKRLVRLFGIAAAVVCLFAVGLYGVLRGDWLNALLAGIALAMSMLPEEFPLVLAVFTAMGAWRISRVHVLTRNASAIETLGAASVLCTDKTGTLTENRMAIAELRLADGAAWHSTKAEAGMSDAHQDLAMFGVLASEQKPFDPMEQAFHRLGAGRLAGHSARLWTLRQAYGLRPDLMAMSQAWQSKAGSNDYVIAAKGAPEAIAELCGLTQEARVALHAAVDQLARDGLRVLALASATYSGAMLPESQREFRFSYLGLAGLADPIREGVPSAVAECRNAGIRVVMITGDYPVTAGAIARQAGIDSQQTISGETVKVMDDAALTECVQTCNVFARITPEQKLRIVNALKVSGEIVAMTGDGVNDAPSLKAAHIGIAMGGRGTDVAREAAALVLLDDKFGSIVEAIRLGRRIHDNLRKALCFIVAVHVPIAGLAILPLLFGLPLVLGPVHIALIELVIDPICSLVFESEREEQDIMRHPPARRKAPLLSLSLLGWGICQGAVAFAIVASIVLFTPRETISGSEIRATAFVALVMILFSLTLINSSFGASLRLARRRPNPALAAVAVAVSAAVAIAFLWPAARTMLGFRGLVPHDLAFGAAASVLCLLILETLKPLWRRSLQA